MSDTINLGPAKALKETDKALLCVLEGGDVEMWVPKSVISDDSEVYSIKSNEGDLIVAAWWGNMQGYEE